MNLVVPAWPGWLSAVSVSASTTSCLWQHSPAQAALGALLAPQQSCVSVGNFSPWNCPEGSHFVPYGGMANGQRLENSLWPSPWLLGRSAGSKLVWKLLVATQGGCGIFCRGVGAGCGCCLVGQAKPTSLAWVGPHISSCSPKRPGSPASWYSQPCRKLCKAHKSSTGE